MSGKVGEGEAVLIRALEPVDGIQLMESRRRTDKLKLLCKGPARLVEALNIQIQQNGVSLLGNNLFIEETVGISDLKIVETARVGISRAKESLYRFYIKDSSFISRK